MTDRPTRRHLVATLVATCLTCGLAGTAQAAPAQIAAIRVSGGPTRTLQALAPLVAAQIATLLGPRYAAGRRGGAILVVHLTEVVLDSFDGGANTLSLPFGHAGGADALQGDVALVGPRHEALAAFPMLATTGATFRSEMRAFPDPRRLDALARAFAWWTVGKLG